MKCNKTQSKWCINKHGALKIIDTFETYPRTIRRLIISIFLFKTKGKAHKGLAAILMSLGVRSTQNAKMKKHAPASHEPSDPGEPYKCHRLDILTGCPSATTAGHSAVVATPASKGGAGRTRGERGGQLGVDGRSWWLLAARDAGAAARALVAGACRARCGVGHANSGSAWCDAAAELSVVARWGLRWGLPAALREVCGAAASGLGVADLGLSRPDLMGRLGVGLWRLLGQCAPALAAWVAGWLCGVICTWCRFCGDVAG
jgi:hypothetical protein